MQDYEKLGAFYLGKQYDMAQRETQPDLLLYDAKDLTTHAVCVGMTGSGKTGLCVSLLEEAGMDGIPAIVIDPKGDLSNLLLTFPELQPSDFRPWVDESQATRNGQTVDEYATATANMWREGLADWQQDGERIRRFREKVDLSIYTPGSNAGLPLTVLRSFDAPPKQVMEDAEALRERISAAASGLLALLGRDTNPVTSREHILISNVFDREWRAGKNLDLGRLIQLIQEPGIDRVGAMDLETFYPADERLKLAMTLNNLLASPSFARWMEGEPLNVKRLLYTAEGKPRISVISIAHLSDPERMFLVTVLLNEVLSWMRTQAGTSSLRALLYMDEVFGYFPPTANPPSKQPMLTLLKQARAYGLGVVLATQNPVDLDYKGLSNTGTWFLGRLQTERDKLRVLEGLEGASAQAGSTFDRQKMEATLAGLGKRVFMMNNVHDDEPVVFHTRWAMSFLRGPLTREQIQKLMKDRKSGEENDDTPKIEPPAPPAPTTQKIEPPSVAGQLDLEQEDKSLPPGVDEFCLPARKSPPEGGRLVYHPALCGQVKLHFVRKTYETDCWRGELILSTEVTKSDASVWNNSRVVNPDEVELEELPESRTDFAELAEPMLDARAYKRWERGLKDHLYRTETLSVWRCPSLKEYSQHDKESGVGEGEDDFRIRMTQTARETRDEEIENLKERYAPKVEMAKRQIERVKDRIEREEKESSESMIDSVLSVGSSLLGALFGRKLASRTNVRSASSSINKVKRTMRERGDVGRAEDALKKEQQDFDDLDVQFKEDVAKIEEKLSIDNLVIEELTVQPRKKDIVVEMVAVVWIPWIVDRDGIAEQAFELKGSDS